MAALNVVLFCMVQHLPRKCSEVSPFARMPIFRTYLFICSSLVAPASRRFVQHGFFEADRMQGFHSW